MLLLTGCGSTVRTPESVPSPADTRGALLMQGLADPLNGGGGSGWAAVTEAGAVAQAKAVCADLAAHRSLADVWRAEMDRATVGMSDADYFTKASAVLYCPRFQSTVGYLH
ncbi:DUF732 domain-containing protein [Streptomyces polygonati]|uniref:DUF732 domain-containing protein n=1 Tax=Streptomyces polygonati TaxID=1617087 RepID=A0ABV8HUH4_9ACTN